MLTFIAMELPHTSDMFSVWMNYRCSLYGKATMTIIMEIINIKKTENSPSADAQNWGYGTCWDVELDNTKIKKVPISDTQGVEENCHQCYRRQYNLGIIL